MNLNEFLQTLPPEERRIPPCGIGETFTVGGRTFKKIVVIDQEIIENSGIEPLMVDCYITVYSPEDFTPRRVYLREVK